MPTEPLTLGSRVSFEGKTGYIRFLGKVQFKDGLWCGLELDAPQGKNDGTVNGVEYFKCTPKHGLFVPAIKVSTFSTPANNSHRLLQQHRSSSSLLKTPALESATPLVDYTPMRLGTVEKRFPGLAAASRNVPLSASKSQGKSDQLEIAFLKEQLSTCMVQLNEQKLAASEYKRAKEAEVEQLLTQITDLLAKHELSIRQYQQKYNETLRSERMQEWKQQMNEKARQWEQAKNAEFEQREQVLVNREAELQQKEVEVQTRGAELQQHAIELQKREAELQKKEIELQQKEQLSQQLHQQKETELQQLHHQLQHQLHHQVQQNDQLSLQLSHQQTELSHLSQLNVQLQAKNSELEYSTLQLEQSLTTTKSEWKAREAQLHHQYSTTIQNMQQQQQQQLNSQSPTLTASASQELSNHKKTIADLEQDAHRLTTDLTDLSRQLQEAQKTSSDSAALEKRNEELNAEIREVLAENNELKAMQQRLEALNEQANDTISELKRQKNEQTAHSNESTQQMHQTTDRIDQLERDLHQARQTIAQLHKELDQERQTAQMHLSNYKDLLSQEQASYRQLILQEQTAYKQKLQQEQASFKQLLAAEQTAYKQQLEATLSSHNHSQSARTMHDDSSKAQQLESQLLAHKAEIANKQAEIDALQKQLCPFTNSTEELDSLFTDRQQKNSLSNLAHDLSTNIQMLQNVANLTDGNRQDLERIAFLAAQIQTEKEDLLGEVGKMLIGIPQAASLDQVLHREDNGEVEVLQKIIHSLQNTQVAEAGALEELYRHLKNEFCSYCQMPGHCTEACCLGRVES